MKKDEIISLIEKTPEADFVIRTAEDEATFLANFKEQEVEKDIKQHIGKLHSQYEQDFETILGQKKPEGVKGYAWIKEEGTKLKSAADKLSQAEVKLAQLETQLKDGKVDEAAKLKIEELSKEVKRLETHHKTAKADWEQSIEKEREMFKNTRIKSDLNHAMMGFKFLPREIIADEVREPFVNQVLSELVKISYYDDSGKLIFKDSKGNIMRGQDAAVVTPSQLLAQRMKPILDNGKKLEGADGGKDGKGKDENPPSTIDVPVTVKTLTELTTYLRTNYPSLKPQSEEYKLAFAKYSKDLKLA